MRVGGAGAGRLLGPPLAGVGTITGFGVGWDIVGGLLSMEISWVSVSSEVLCACVHVCPQETMTTCKFFSRDVTCKENQFHHFEHFH